MPSLFTISLEYIGFLWLLIGQLPRVLQCDAKTNSSNKAKTLLSVSINGILKNIAREGNAKGQGTDPS